MDILNRYYTNQDKYLNIILSLNNILPKDVIHIIGFLYIQLLNPHFLHNLCDRYVLRTDKDTYMIPKKNETYNMLDTISPNDIKQIYNKMYDLDNEYIIIQTHTHLYMIINNKLEQLNISNFITASVGKYHNMILTTNGVFATGLNDIGQLGFEESIGSSYLSRVEIENVQSISAGVCYTLWLSNNQLFFCGTHDYNNWVWTPHLIKTDLIIRHISSCRNPQRYVGENPQIITDTEMYEINQIMDEKAEYHKIGDLNYKNVVKIINTQAYTLILTRENNESNLYIYNITFNPISDKYNLNGDGLQKIPIDDIIDISNDGILFLTKSRLYIFDENIPYFSNIIQDDHFINITDLNTNSSTITDLNTNSSIMTFLDPIYKFITFFKNAIYY